MKIKPDPRNARKHPLDNLKAIEKSLKELGVGRSIVVDSEGVVIGGNAVYEEAVKQEIPIREVKTKGDELVVVRRVDLKTDDPKRKALALADNQIALLAEWDMPLLDEIKLEIEDIDLGVMGFELPIEEGLIEDDEIPEKVETRCKTGDLWQLGNHRLLCGDATKREDVERLMGGEKAVLLATDPPYGDSWVQKAKDMHAVGYGHSRAVRHGSIASDDKVGKELKCFLDAFLSCAKLAGDPPFPIYVWHRAKRMLFEQALLDAGYLVHQPVIWVKPSFVIGRLHYHPRCEWALHGWLQGNGKCAFYGARNQSDVWEVARENDKLHPTQKPVILFEIPIKNHTQVGQICFEPFAGSGTQVIACEKLDRRCFMMEIDEHYCDVIITRWQNYTGKEAVKYNESN